MYRGHTHTHTYIDIRCLFKTIRIGYSRTCSNPCG